VNSGAVPVGSSSGISTEGS